jgi:hypothetical protein
LIPPFWSSVGFTAGNNYHFLSTYFQFSGVSMSHRDKIKLSAAAVGAVAIGSFAVGALAIGMVAIGRVFIRRLAVSTGSLESLEIGELTVHRLRVKELQVEDDIQLPLGQSLQLREPA